MNSQTVEVIRAVERIKPHLAGRLPEMQGAILADLLATWLAGHQVKDDPAATRKLRTEILAQHLVGVVELVGTEP